MRRSSNLSGTGSVGSSAFTVLVVVGLLCLAGLGGPASAQDADRKAALEAEFERTMSGSVLVGQFTMDGIDAELREERYTIEKVTKIGEDRWRFDARVQYGQFDVTVPIPLDVKWAGDTPVISLTDLSIPGLGTYTSRVLVYRGHYAGTWSGKDYGGKLFGRIERMEAEEAGSDAGGEVAAGSNPASGSTPTIGVDAVGTLDGDATPWWPSFRGPRASGVSETADLPTEWDVTAGQNLQWKTELPGLSHSSPVVHGNRIFLTTSVGEQDEAQLTVGLYGSIMPVADEGRQSFRVMCLDRRTGQILWSKVAFEGEPAVARHPKGSHAACTVATDGKHVVAFFGTEGLFCYDIDGQLMWAKFLGDLDAGFFRVPNAQWGFGSSPILHEGRVILQVDIQGQSFVAALDAATGAEIWRTNRDEVPTWCTPTIYEHAGTTRIAINGWKHVGGYDFETGEEVWKLTGGGDIPVPAPVVGDGLLYFTSAHGAEAPIYAIRTSAEGTVTKEEGDENMAWHIERRGNYMQTPLIAGPFAYFCNDAGILSCYDAATGEEHYRERLGPGGRKGFTASPVAAGGRLYVTSEEGEIYVVKIGQEFELVSTNSMGEICMATPAIAENTLLVRSARHLFAIGPSASQQ